MPHVMPHAIPETVDMKQHVHLIPMTTLPLLLMISFQVELQPTGAPLQLDTAQAALPEAVHQTPPLLIIDPALLGLHVDGSRDGPQLPTPRPSATPAPPPIPMPPASTSLSAPPALPPGSTLPCQHALPPQ